MELGICGCQDEGCPFEGMELGGWSEVRSVLYLVAR